MMTWSGQAAAMRRCTACRQASMKSASAPETAQSSGPRGQPQSSSDTHLRKLTSTRAVVDRIADRSKAALAELYKPSTREEHLAFLPAALEIVETPPPPLAGAMSGT